MGEIPAYENKGGGNLKSIRFNPGVVFVLILSAIFISCANGSGGSAVLSSWVQMGPSGNVIARVITGRAECPDIRLDNETETMTVRSTPDADFPVLVCETVIPSGTVTAALDTHTLKLPGDFITRLVVIGDTGCRLEDGAPPQSCNDPEAWPFERIARSAARLEPDLVIHIGDYPYRQDACPAEDTGCEGSSFGDNYAGWDADFFSPAGALLSAAPWVFTRGNHEICSRYGKGWFTFLDPNPPFPECEQFTPPYTVDLGPVELLMLDSASADDNSAPGDLVDEYRVQVKALEAAAGDNAWFVVHHPLWGIGESQGELFMINDTLMAATDNSLKEGIDLVLSGHIHFFELLSFEGSRPPQLLVGNSGTELDSAVSVPFSGLEVGGGTVKDGVSLSEFGFVLMELKGGVWEVSVRDKDGNELLACGIDGTNVSCFP